MYIDYTKLWKLLVEKNLSKTDLMEMTGISSRVLAKMAKNETVTTNTIARICAALGCDVGDVMECVGEDRLSVYDAYKKYGVCEEGELVKAVRFTLAGRAYTVYQTKRTATKATRILCEKDRTVYWSQLYPVGYIVGTPVKEVLIKPIPREDETVIVLIKGKPESIAGLDENGFVSARGTPKSKSDVYVMSETAFKLFVPKN